MKLKKNYVIIFMTLALAGGITACKGKSGESLAIGMDDFIAKHEQNPQIQVLDVRTQQEYASGHVPGAKLVPVDDVVAGASIPYEKGSEIYVICRSGKRSMRATEHLRANGFDKVYSINGGTEAWIAKGKPVEN